MLILKNRPLNQITPVLLLAMIFSLLLVIPPARGEAKPFHFRFAVISDVHMDATAKDDPSYFKLLNQTKDLLETTIAELNLRNEDNDPANDIDFVLFTGDNSNSEWMDDYTLLSESLEILKIPFYITPGDWDYAADFSPGLINKTYSVPYENLNEHVMFEQSAVPGLRRYDFSVDYKNKAGDSIHLIGMDDVLHFNGNRGSFEKDQLKWLSDDLDINKGKPVIIFQHCPVISPFSDSKDTPPEKVQWLPYTIEMEKDVPYAQNEFLTDIPMRKDRAADRSDEFLGIVEQHHVPLVIMGDFHVNKKVPYPESKPSTLLALNPALVSFPCAYTIYDYDQNTISWEVRQVEKYAQKCRDYAKASYEKYNTVYAKIGSDQYAYNIEKAMKLSWGSDSGDPNDWRGSFKYD